jgi:hypothetical protein
MPVVMVDPDNDLAALPQGIMQVCVKMCPSGIPHASDLEQLYPRAMPHRQLFLVQLSYFEAFLQCIRHMEFAYGVRVMPGQQFPSQHRLGNGHAVPVTAVNGQHGLNMQVVVNNPEYPTKRMNKLLEQSRMFHSPLNEVTIIGCADPAFARSIETSISTPRDASQLTWHELTILTVQRTKTAADLITSSGGWVFAYMIHDLLGEMHYNATTIDATSWTGSLQMNWLTRPFETLMHTLPYLNVTYTGLEFERLQYYHSVQSATTANPAPVCQEMSHFNAIAPEYEGWMDLLADLHCMFNAHIANDDAAQTQRLIVVRHGMDLVDSTAGSYAHLPAEDTALLRKASNMSTWLRYMDSASNTTRLLQDLDNFSDEIATDLGQQRRPLKWAVHESLIPTQLAARGVLTHMTDCSTMSDEDSKRFLVVRAFNITGEGTSYWV